ERLRNENERGFPEKVTAFREGMAVHGRYGQPCAACGTTVQRIRYAEDETDDCPRCQTDGKLLADRSLSRLRHVDSRRPVEQWEEATGAYGVASSVAGARATAPRLSWRPAHVGRDTADVTPSEGRPPRLALPPARQSRTTSWR